MTVILVCLLSLVRYWLHNIFTPILHWWTFYPCWENWFQEAVNLENLTIVYVQQTLCNLYKIFVVLINLAQRIITFQQRNWKSRIPTIPKFPIHILPFLIESSDTRKSFSKFDTIFMDPYDFVAGTPNTASISQHRWHPRVAEWFERSWACVECMPEVRLIRLNPNNI